MNYYAIINYNIKNREKGNNISRSCEKILNALMVAYNTELDKFAKEDNNYRKHFKNFFTQAQKLRQIITF